MNDFCKICGSPTAEMVHKKFRLKYYYCHECGFISKDENSLISPEKELEIYSRHNNSIDDPRYVAYFKRFIEEAVIPFCRGKRGLDYGSGPSPVLATILERDYGFSMDIYDLFFSPDRIYEGKTYAMITSTEVIEHLENPLEHFEIFKKCMGEGSVLSIMTLFHPESEEEFLNWYYMRDMSHISFYTPQTMRVIGEKPVWKLSIQIICVTRRTYRKETPPVEFDPGRKNFLRTLLRFSLRRFFRVVACQRVR